MKLADLIQEGPVFLPPSPSETVEDEKGTYISKNTYRRNYNKIAEFQLQQPIGKYSSVDIMFNVRGRLVEGTIPAKRPIDGDMGYRIVFSLMFKDALPNHFPQELLHKKVVQVDGVSTHKQFDSKGLATFVYFTLARMGYTIISDFYHEYGGLKLWRKLARLAGLNNYTVNILLENGEFVKDKEGNVLNFNDGNYPKSKIWSTSPNQKLKNVLLVMRAAP